MICLYLYKYNYLYFSLSLKNKTKNKSLRKEKFKVFVRKSYYFSPAIVNISYVFGHYKRFGNF